MRSRRLAPALFALLFAPCALGVDRPRGLGDVLDVRTWSHPDYTRVVVELTKAVGAEVRRLSADAEAPERLYLDLEEIWVGRRYVDGIPVGDGLLRGVRLGQNTLRTTRVVIDLDGYERHRLLVLRAPHRVVVDVYGSREAPETLRWPDPKRGSESGPPSRLSMPLRPVQTVVIDPGHGGRDPGATGIGGMREKDVNLRLALLLAPRLEKLGFRVVLTRNDDRTLDLEERTVIAESVGGDLFVSIHTNASTRRRTRGIEIYYLDENHERHSLEVAARENGVRREDMDSLQLTLARLRLSEASDHSSVLADFVHDEVAPGLSRNYRGVLDLGVKKGPFYVLFLSSMPSILVETGFLTNRDDAKLLRNRDFLEALATRIAAGLVRYREARTQMASGAVP